jgi:hypothetical protein
LAVDRDSLSDRLSRCYDFTGKVVLYAGAGGGQLLHSSIKADRYRQKHGSLERARANHPVEVIGGPFEDVSRRAEVVYFEFSLHEMSDPWQALNHAHNLASEIAVFDHSPASEWVLHAAEEDCVRQSTEVMERFGMRRAGQRVLLSTSIFGISTSCSLSWVGKALGRLNARRVFQALPTLSSP